MTDFLTATLLVLLQPLGVLLNPHDPRSVYYLVAALVFAVFAYFGGRRWMRRRGLGRALAAAFPRRIFAHPSALLDFRFFLAVTIVGPLIFAVAIASSGVWSGLVQHGLAALFGPAGPGLAPSWALDAALTLAAVLAFELGYWLGHFLLHRVPALWEIHKVHHSAEVMTPATAARVHPLEDVLLSNFIAVALGVVYGLSSYVLGGGAHELTLFEVNVVFVAFYLTTYHLRHSHLWLRVPRPLAYVLHSPAHHQIHHSADPAHFDRNFGFALSLWDWAFGTLHVPGSRRPAAFGIGAESKDYTSVGRLFLLPFVKIARAWRPRAGAMAEPR